jgi:hypothetical protein
MKIKGKKYDTPNRELIVIPRGDNEPIVFTAEAVLDYEEFDATCPLPLPPIIQKPGGEKIQDIHDEQYRAKVEKHGKRRLAWTILKSLQATEDLEWETVDMKNPETWENYHQELKDSKFSVAEINSVIYGVLAANNLDEDKVEAARKSFLAGREVILNQ